MKNIKYLIVSILLLSFYGQAAAQEERRLIDSLTQTLNSPLTDSVQAATLYKLSRLHTKEDKAQSISYLEQYIALEEALAGDKPNLDAWYKTARQFDRLGEYAKARDYQQQALEGYRQTEDLDRYQASLRSLMDAYISLTDYASLIPLYEEMVVLKGRREEVLSQIEYQSTLIPLYRIQNDLEGMKTAGTRAIDICLEVDNDSMRYRVLSTMGYNYQVAGRWVEALKYRHQLLEMGRQTQSPFRIYHAYKTLADQYVYFKDYEQGLVYYQLARDLDWAEKSPTDHMNDFQNIGMMFEKNHLYDSALWYFEQALTVISRNPDIEELYAIHVTHNIGSTLVNMGRPEEGRPYLEKALAVHTRLQHNQEMSWDYSELAAMELALGDYESSIEYGLKAKALAEALNMAEVLKNASETLYKAYRAMGNYEQGLEHLETFKAMGDSLFNAQAVKEVAIKQQQFEQARLDDQAVAKLERQKAVNFVLVIAFVVAMALVVSIYRGLLARRRAHATIALRNQQIEEALEQKQLLLEELQHRTKNNLNMIENLLLAQARGAKDEGARELLDESRFRVNAIGIIHAQLYESGTYEQVDMRSYLLTLVGGLEQSLPTGTTVNFELEIEPVLLEVKHALPIGLIVNEAVLNALKYAFAIPNNPLNQVSVTLAYMAPDQYELKVKDNGQGLAKGAEQRPSTGSGIRLMQGLARQIHSKLELNDDQGLEIRLPFVVQQRTKALVNT